MAKRRNAISGQFIAHPRQMLESPAMRVLSLAARRTLDRIELEHLEHGGAENGKLPVTYRQLEEWGVRRHTVASAIRELEALGLIRITRRGYSGAAELRSPTLYELTFRPAWNARGDGTHEYRQIATVEEAETLAQRARKEADPRNVRRGQIQNATPRSVHISPHEKGGETAKSRPTKRGVQAHPTKRGAPSISRDVELRLVDDGNSR
jgi:hypothetical protein